MGPLRRCAVPLVLLLAAACGSPHAGPDTTLSAAGGAAGAEPSPTLTSSTSSTAVVPATVAPTTTARPPATTAAPTTAPARPRPTAPPAPAPAPTEPPGTVLAVAPETVSPVSTSVTQGSTTAIVRAVREQYLGEKVYVWVEATSAERITSIEVDFGDGYVTTDPQPLPSTLLFTKAMSASTTRAHVYPAAGRYRIRVTLTVVPGIAAPVLAGPPSELQWNPSGPEHAVTVTTDIQQRPDPAPFEFPRLP
ncbi:MAG: hypothetical protein Q8K72_01110 [Acidimicrobiales bacterium]|nr:hypothetical protein [Acidimicrobiales bacterium]